MEFFATTANRLRVDDLYRHVRVANLSSWCASIDRVLSQQGEQGEIYCIWGQFRVNREMIGDGVRFTLPGCRNGLQWTVTVEDSSPLGRILIHCTINRPEADADFEAPPAAANACPTWYG